MEWWKQKNGILQIYPRSFRDSNSDGVGDLTGIIEKLPYIKGEADSLGVDAIWLSPFFTSPMRDFGYDVQDYCDVDPIFGTLDDFKQLISAAHARDIAVIIDLVPNHTSNLHPWFQEALAHPESEKREYYYFETGQDDSPPNNWLSVFGGPAWELDDASREYYLHSFLPEQPDLNWQNPAVQQEFEAIIDFWCGLGVDGFRADAVRWMGKDSQLRDDPVNEQYEAGMDPYDALRHVFSRYSPELDLYLKSITNAIEKFPKRIILFEDYIDYSLPVEAQISRMYNVAPDVAAPFNFEGMVTAQSTRDLAAMVKRYEGIAPERSVVVYCFGNHDKPRLASRVGIENARVLAVVQLTLPGLPVVYYGDELGMANGDIPQQDIQDPFEKRVPHLQLGRDPARTPMQWDDSHLAGFSANATSWLPVNSSYQQINVATEQLDPHSMLQLYRRLYTLRSRYSELRSGGYQEMYVDDQLYIYARTGQESYFLTVANFGPEKRQFTVPPGGEIICDAQQVMPTVTTVDGQGSIDPHNAIVIAYPVSNSA